MLWLRVKTLRPQVGLWPAGPAGTAAKCRCALPAEIIGTAARMTDGRSMHLLPPCHRPCLVMATCSAPWCGGRFPSHESGSDYGPSPARERQDHVRRPSSDRAIERSKAAVAQLAGRYDLNEKTVCKWRKRASVQDMPMGPKVARSTTLSAEEEAVCIAFRPHTLLPLSLPSGRPPSPAARTAGQASRIGGTASARSRQRSRT